MNSIFSNLTETAYRNAVKPVFFKFDPEMIHEFMVGNGELFGRIPVAKSAFEKIFAFRDPSLRQTIAGIDFSNPIGLAAGFDYNAQLTQILGSVGFGFQTVGTITLNSYVGNAKPRLGRLPKSRSLLVNKGFKNPGIDAICQKLHDKQFTIPVGVSIGSSNKSYNSSEEMIDDVLRCFEVARKHLTHNSYYELNISCPNLEAGEPFLKPNGLKQLLKEVDSLKLKKPVFLKMPTDKSVEEANALLKVASGHSIAGAIFGNLTKDRKNPDLVPEEVAKATKGNFSGKPTEKRSNTLLEAAYKEYGQRFVLIGCGGVFNAENAYRKIKLGASLVQMITGMIYEGPQVVGQINQGLVKLMNQDGYSHISEAVGTGV